MQQILLAACFSATVDIFKISGSGLEEFPGFRVSLVFFHALIPRKGSSNLKTFLLFERSFSRSVSKELNFKGIDLQSQLVDAVFIFPRASKFHVASRRLHTHILKDSR